LQRKLRALLTGIAIVLGVALMAGTYILTDTINHSFAEVFGSAYKNKAVVVTAKETLGRKSGSRKYRDHEATLARVRAVPGVAAASAPSPPGRRCSRRAASGSPAPRIVRCAAAGALRVLHRGEGLSAARRRRGRDRPGDRRSASI
jgi:hypothetical protein